MHRTFNTKEERASAFSVFYVFGEKTQGSHPFPLFPGTMVSYAADGLERVYLSRGRVRQLPSVVGRAQRFKCELLTRDLRVSHGGQKQTLFDCVSVCYQ